MTRKTTKSNERPTIVLKTILDDIYRDNKNATITSKQMRAKLRATPSMREIHTHNASWIFTQSQYDVVRAMFDPAHAQRVERRTKRDAKARTKSRDANTSNEAPAAPVDNANVDA